MATDESDAYRDLTNRLFATATAMLEDSIEHAVAGQSSKASLTHLLRQAERLHQAAVDIDAIARACVVAAKLAQASARVPAHGRRKRRRK